MHPATFLNPASVQSHLLTLVSQTCKLLMICLSLQLPLAFWYSNTVSGLGVLNILAHLILLMFILLLCQRKALRLARFGLHIGFVSYLLCAMAVWGDNLFVQHFLLLGIVTCGVLYSSKEVWLQGITASLFASIFLIEETARNWPYSQWEQVVRLANATTLAMTSLTLLVLVRHFTLSQWRQLKTINRQTGARLRNLVPSRPGHPEELWQPGEIHRLSPVTVLFADFAGYTGLSEQFDDDHIVELLDALYREFDCIAARFGVEKIKTNGDEYMAASGLQTVKPSAVHCLTPAHAMCLFALRLQRCFTIFCHSFDLPCQLRIGIASGSVTAGIIGEQKTTFDIWGQTVNYAARLEQQASPGTIHCCAETRRTSCGPSTYEPLGFVELAHTSEPMTFECRAANGYNAGHTHFL